LVSYYTFEESKSPKTVKVLKHFVSGVKAKENRKYIVIALLLIFAGVISERLYGVIMNNSEIVLTPKKTVEIPPSPSIEIINTPLSLQKGPFLNNDFAKLVPSDISIYLEFNDLSFLEFVTENDLGNGWGAIIELKQESIVEVAAELDQFKEKGLKAGISDKYLLVSASENIYENMLRAKDSLILNLVRNPFYSQTKAKAVPEGKILILKMSQVNDAALEEVLKFNYFGSGENLSNISQLMERILNSRYNELVIN